MIAKRRGPRHVGLRCANPTYRTGPGSFTLGCTQIRRGPGVRRLRARMYHHGFIRERCNSTKTITCCVWRKIVQSDKTPKVVTHLGCWQQAIHRVIHRLCGKAGLQSQSQSLKRRSCEGFRPMRRNCHMVSAGGLLHRRCIGLDCDFCRPRVCPWPHRPGRVPPANVDGRRRRNIRPESLRPPGPGR